MFLTISHRICSETLPTEIGLSSCSATLHFDSPLDALSVCEISPITFRQLNNPRILDLAFGLLHQPMRTSISGKYAHRLTKGLLSLGVICLITLEYGVHLMTDNLQIRSDLPSCNEIPPIKLQVSLPNPLNALIMEVLLWRTFLCSHQMQKQE